ncbi:MAG TPA: L-erythro-3,5-diaminohexanoate dehydrogenase [Streptosporangiaceae bacterium]|nr:L-erythro-3,5-diaminohexanoate dehydrogenase [Streptosporangiaceae bacterium]
MPRSRPYPHDGDGPEPGHASAGTGVSLNGQASAAGSPLGLHRVLEPAGVLPQAAWRLNAKAAIWPDEVRVAVTRLNLDAASFRQLREAHDGNPDKIRASVLDIIRTRGKMQNPVTGSGGMLTGTVAEVGPESPLGLAVGDKIATLVSLSLTPLVITDGLAGWDGKSEQVPCEGHAILFGRSIAAKLPDDLPAELALSVMDVCGAPALTHRVVAGCQARSSQACSGQARGPVVAIIGAAGKSGSLSAAAARQAGAGRIIGVVPHEAEAQVLRDAGDATSGQPGLVDEIVIADARNPVAVSRAIENAGGPADVTVVCVDVAGCEGGAILATAQRGTVIFFSMATSFTAAALGAEGVAADVTMLVGNGYVPGHAQLALDLIRAQPAVRGMFQRRIDEHSSGDHSARNHGAHNHGAHNHGE